MTPGKSADALMRRACDEWHDQARFVEWEERTLASSTVDYLSRSWSPSLRESPFTVRFSGAVAFLCHDFLHPIPLAPVVAHGIDRHPDRVVCPRQAGARAEATSRFVEGSRDSLDVAQTPQLLELLLGGSW
jgi:hypothetical protein